MKIRRMNIKGFRCLQDLSIEFDDELTVIVGENDSGKSSMVDCIRTVTQGLSVEQIDFSAGKTEMEIEVILDDLRFIKGFSLADNQVVNTPLIAKPTAGYISMLKSWLNSEDTDFGTEEETEKLRATASLFGIRVQSNSRKETLISGLLEAIEQSETDPEYHIENARFPAFNNIQLDGKQFENVSAFFKEAFLKGRQSTLWDEAIDGTQTIRDFVKHTIDGYADDIARQLEESGIKEQIKVFLPTLTDIKIVPNYSHQDFNLTAEVKFLENGTVIDMEKKGDGTKRRITMALLELKKEAALIEDDSSTIYLLDEPDTHLHVRAQLQLLDTLKDFSLKGHQIILATHSPFLINAVKPESIIMLCPSSDNCTTSKSIRPGGDLTEQALRALGIENVYLYFARNIVLVEGETEEKFVHSFHRRIFGKEPSANLIKIIDVNGIHNIYGFSRAIELLHDPARVHIIHDQEMRPETSELIDQLRIPGDNRYVSGTREFEDSFEPNVIFIAWKQYLEENGRNIPESWTVEEIEACREACRDDNARKFSAELRRLNAGSGRKMSKPILGSVLGEYIQAENVPESLMRLFQVLEAA